MTLIKMRQLVDMQLPERYPYNHVHLFLRLLIEDETNFAIPAIRDLCTEFLDCSVMLVAGLPAFQNHSPSEKGTDTWYNFLRCITFIGGESPELAPRLPGGDLGNLFGALTPSGRGWENECIAYTHTVSGEDPATDKRIPSKKRWDIKQLQVTPTCSYTAYDVCQLVPEIVAGWTEGHASSYGARNGFTQLCLWRWLLVAHTRGLARVYTCFWEKTLSVCGYVNTAHGWVFQTYWQPLPITQPLGTATLRATLPLLPVGDKVFLTCPSVTGNADDSKYEMYKRKFATDKQPMYSEFLAPFEASPPYFNTLTQQTVKA